MLEHTSMDEIKDLSFNLVKIDSAPESGTRQVAEYLKSFLRKEGLAVRIESTPEPKHCNLIATLPGEEKGYRLLLNGHLDTVPQADPPQSCSIRNGRLYGRGSADMKSALAAMCMAMLDIHRAGTRLKHGVMLTAVAGEELGGFGTEAFLKTRRKTDMAIVGEPTQLRLVTSHKGVEWTRIIVKGRSGHASCPEEGVNAISYAAKIALALEEKVSQIKLDHPQLGNPTLNIGFFHGGKYPNIIPDLCEVRLDRRWLPGESIGQIYNMYETTVDEVLQDTTDVKVSIERMTETKHARPLNTPLDSPLVQTLQVILRELGYPDTLEGVSYSTDASWLSEYGIPAVICGPGNIAQAHSRNEFIELDQVYAATEIYKAAIEKLCG